MRALITGAAGFVGGHLAEHLRAGGHEVIGLDRGTIDLRDAGATRAAVAEAEPDWIFHLAAEASVARSWREPQATIRNNLEVTLNVLDAGGSRRVLVAGSGEVYGPPRELPVGEDHPLVPQTPYASSKAAADLPTGFYADDV